LFEKLKPAVADLHKIRSVTFGNVSSHHDAM